MVTGYWGPITANYDWCEPNYQHTHYVAEFFNTLSSVPICLVGLYSFRMALTHQYGFNFLCASLGLFVVGVGSVVFHGTLLRQGQVLDEVPMIWSSSLFLWIGLSLRCSCDPKRIAQLGFALSIWVLGATAAYFQNGGFEMFISCYVLTITAIVVCSAVQLYFSPVQRQVLPFVLGALGFYVGGVLILWVPEQLLCGNRNIEHHDSILLRLPVPLHAVFHLTSSAGPLCWLIFATYEWLYIQKRKPKTTFQISLELCGLPLPVVTPCGDRGGELQEHLE